MSAPDSRELLGKALVEIRALKARLKEVEAARHEPIAIVGYGCRFPRAGNPAAFWRLLRDGVDAVREVPRDRFDVDAWYDPDPDVPGRIYTKSAAFLERVDGFDSGFFSISPREVQNLSPQQRLLLEVAWETFEDANLPPAELFGSSMGVFIGQCGFDEGPWNATGPRRPEEIDLYSLTGTTLSITAGRLSYFFGVTGPSLAVDTACSSSLVALQLACQSLRQGDCERALVGGVHVLTSPSIMLGLCRIKALAPDGRCKTFDARADGYGRGEGCGVVLLRRLSDALAAGDRIHAVIRGVAINQDGASGGLTVPSGPSQAAAIRRALADGSVDPADVAYVEAHGTGTSLGDPIEIGALRAVHGDRPRERPLYVGSVKSNIGHLEAAAGIAGLLKAVLALEHRAIPPSLHFETPNPHIPWDSLPFRVPTRCLPWPEGVARTAAGVSSFGLGGTNVHVVVEAAPATPAAHAAQVAAPDSPLKAKPVLLLSGRDEAALREAAAQMERELAAAPDASIGDLCHVAATGRTHFAERAALAADDRDALVARLKELALGRVAAGVERGRVDEGQPPEIGFLFPAGEAVDALARCAARWRSFGVVPDFVAGEGSGAIAAAADAGILSVEEAVGWSGALSRRGTPEGDGELARRIGSTQLKLPRCRFVAPISGTFAGDEVATPAFWLRVLREAAASSGAARGAAPGVLPIDASKATPEGRRPRRLLIHLSASDGAQRRDALDALVDELVRAHLSGARVNWSAVEGGARRGAATLPTYPFQRESYPWSVAPGPAAAAGAAASAATPFSSWLYESRWIAQRAAEAKGSEPGRWLLFADRGGVADELARALASLGATAVVAKGGAEELARLLAEGASAPLRGVVHLAGIDAASGDLRRAALERGARAACESALLLAQGLARLPARGRPRLTIVTRGAQPVAGNAIEPLQAMLWGLARSLALESPEIWGGLVDLDPALAAAASAAALARELLAASAAPSTREERVALRGSERFVERIARCEAAAAAPLKLRPDASYLVTGGLGGIGLELAQRLAARGAKHLVLLGRKAPSESARALLERIAKLGCETRVHAVDVANDLELEPLLAGIDRSGAPLRGIFHCAGVVEDAALARQGWSHFEKVLASKLHGSAALHRLTEGRQLDHFVLFSSLAAILGSVGQANYAAANGYLDALAAQRRARGLPALSIQWGAWSEVGLARDDAILRGLADRGFGAMANAPAFDALEWAMAQGRPRVAIAPVEWPRFLEQLPPDSPRSLFAEFVNEGKRPAAAASDAAESAALRAELERGSPAERLRRLKKLVAEQVAWVLRLPPSHAVDEELGFFQMGMNSLTTLELRRRVGSRLALTVSATMVFDHPTVRGLAARLAQELFGAAAGEMETPAAPPAAAPPRADAGAVELDDVPADAVGRLLDRELESLGDLLDSRSSQGPGSAPERSK
jgi:acyl transferase domain-containing protein